MTGTTALYHTPQRSRARPRAVAYAARRLEGLLVTDWRCWRPSLFPLQRFVRPAVWPHPPPFEPVKAGAAPAELPLPTLEKAVWLAHGVAATQDHSPPRSP